MNIDIEGILLKLAYFGKVDKDWFINGGYILTDEEQDKYREWLNENYKRKKK